MVNVSALFSVLFDQPIIDEVHFTVLIDPEVVRLDVSVDVLRLMQLFDALKHLSRERRQRLQPVVLPLEPLFH